MSKTLILEVEPETTKPIRHQQREATRERLLQATIDLLRSEGVAALTTTRVTQQAGIVQSGFYMHFKNIDDCKRAAAERVAAEIREFIHVQRIEAKRLDPNDFDSLRRQYEQVLNIFNLERNFSDLFLRFRHDASPLGDVMRELERRLHVDLTEDLIAIFRLGKLTEKKRKHIALQAELILAMVLAAGEALIQGRVEKARTAAELLAINTFYAAKSDFASPSTSIKTPA